MHQNLYIYTREYYFSVPVGKTIKVSTSLKSEDENDLENCRQEWVDGIISEEPGDDSSFIRIRNAEFVYINGIYIKVLLKENLSSMPYKKAPFTLMCSVQPWIPCTICGMTHNRNSRNGIIQITGDCTTGDKVPDSRSVS